MVKISLPEASKTIVAGKYQLYLPGEKQLIEEMKKTLRQDKDDIEKTEKMKEEADFELQTPNTKQK
jgi:hypothetical protein